MTAYLDHAATTPLLPAARAALIEALDVLGNPSAVNAAGRGARRLVEESRERLAGALGATPSEVIFTSGGTEADNLAIKGAYAARRLADPARHRLVLSGIEHHAVLDPVEYLCASQDANVTFVEPTPDGVVTASSLRAALAQDDPEDVALVSVMWANNEIGTIQPIPDLSAVAREHGIPMHCDAVQAVGHIPVDFAASGVDLLSLTGHKLGGPVGTGALLARRDAQVVPQMHGGGQERQIRSGTLDVAGTHALAVAVETAVHGLDAEAQRLIALRDNLIGGALALGLGIEVTGAWTKGSAADRLPGNVHLRVPGTDGDSLLFLLDAAGIDAATGSACTAGVPRTSHVVLALGIPEDEAGGAIRLSLGHTSTHADVDAVLAALPEAVARARRARGAA
ncbi:cysteine desulfurase family protein [Nostocoides jenkinsii]|uniref:cysteine desulfurase n=1 Tax=Nostocoides jenkinsii Ben 74 TaxID=1193518 RepID=A0A077M6J3_9MICO|nr:cysteine desulfurase family protein [Tetrasphaera jenkinsii]CCI51395.1 putative cysteine desulfurase [Tetrasphaera jenkinsii Ben 74]